MNAKSSIRTGFAALLGTACALACPSLAAAQARDPIEMIAQADANGDGAVSWSEVVALRTRNFQRLDRNTDGYISAKDRPPGPFAARFDEAMAQVKRQFDANSDGRVSRSEMIDAPGLIFTQGDVNRNGILSVEELANLHAAASAR